jgi:hypothetical protein
MERAHEGLAFFAGFSTLQGQDGLQLYTVYEGEPKQKELGYVKGDPLGGAAFPEGGPRRQQVFREIALAGDGLGLDREIVPNGQRPTCLTGSGETQKIFEIFLRFQLGLGVY